MDRVSEIEIKYVKEVLSKQFRTSSGGIMMKRFEDAFELAAHTHIPQAPRSVGNTVFQLNLFQLPMKINGIIDMRDQFALWPHEYFSTLYNSYQHEFKSRILPDRSKIRAFWNAVSNHPLLDNHPVLDVLAAGTTMGTFNFMLAMFTNIFVYKIPT